MPFELPNHDNKLPKKINGAIIKASLEAEKTQTPERSDVDKMLEMQKEIAIETTELKSDGIFSKIPEKLKKRLLIAFTGATLFFSMGAFDEAEGRRHGRDHNYSDILKDCAEDIIRDTSDSIIREQRARERWERDQRRKIERKESQFDHERQEARREYRRAVDRARSQEEINNARYTYELKLDSIDEAEAREMHGRY